MSKSHHNTIVVFAHGHVMRAVKMLTGHKEKDRHALMTYYRDTMLKMDVPNTHILEIDLPLFL